MKKSIRARGFMPALSLLSLAVAASVHAQVIEINPVVVSASRVEQPLSEVLSSVSVITRQDIEKSQAPTLADLLLGEAGFEFGRNGGPGATTSFFLRGQDSTNVVIMVDGVRSQADAIGALTMTDMPLAQIERIEILRGNAGALYGESAIGGVINIFTRKGKGVPRAYGALTYGSRNTSEMNAGYGGSIADYSFDFNAGITKTDGFSSMNPSQNTAINPERDGYSNRFASVKVDKKINSDLTLGVRANIKNSKTDFDNDSFGSGRQSDTHQFKITSDLVGVSARQAVTDAWVSSLDFSGSNFSYENIKNGATPLTGLYNGHQDTVRWFNAYQLQTNTLVNFGVDRLNEQYQQRSSYNMTRDTLGYFVGLTNKVNQFTFQANVRRDSVNVASSMVGQPNDTQATTGLLGLGYQVSPQWRLTSTVSTGFRAATADEASLNPLLNPEKHKAYEVGIVYSSGESVARVTYFQTSTHDAIIYNSDYSATTNLGEVRNKGVEGTVRSRWMGNNIKLTIVKQDPWNITDNERLARRANQYGSLDVSRSIAHYELGARVYASGDRKNSHWDTESLGGYAIWSFYASRKIDNEWTARVKLENVFDRQYQLAYGYNTPGRGIFATLQYQPK